MDELQQIEAELARRGMTGEAIAEAHAIEAELARRGVGTRMPVNEGLGPPSEWGQSALDIAGQGAGAAAMAGITMPAGPAGMVPGMMAGGYAGKRIARKVGGLLGLKGNDAEITAGEDMIDAAATVAGPAGHAVAKPIARAITRVERGAVQKKFTEAAAHVLNTAPPGADPAKLAKEASRMASASVAKDAAERSTGSAALPGAVVGSMAMLEPITGALIGAGVSAATLKWAVPALLRSKAGPAFVEWSARKASFSTKARIGEAATSLAALAAGEALSPEERKAVRAIGDEMTGGDSAQSRIARTQRVHAEKVTQARDPRTGRFTSGIDHSGLDDMFGGAP
jgi:hypothetical protein